MLRSRFVAVVFAGIAALPLGAGTALAATPTPSPSEGLGSTGSGPGFVVLAVILIGALLFSTWRLRRGR